MCYRRLTPSLTTVKLGLYVRLSLLIVKIMFDQAPLQCFSKTKGCKAWKLSEQTQFSYRTGVICRVVTPKGNAWNGKTPLQKNKTKPVKIFGRFWGTVKLFCKKVLLRDLSSTLETNLSLQEYQEDECKSLIKAQ